MMHEMGNSAIASTSRVAPPRAEEGEIENAARNSGLHSGSCRSTRWRACSHVRWNSITAATVSYSSARLYL